MLTVHDAAQSMGIDYMDDVVEANLQRALNSALYRLYGAVGRDVEDRLPDDPRIDELLRIYTEEAYDNHPRSGKQDSAQNHLRDALELQLRTELRRAKAEAGGGAS